MTRNIESVFVVTNYKTGKSQELTVNATGQEACKVIRGEYLGQFVKVVLEGFEIEGNFVPLRTR